MSDIIDRLREDSPHLAPIACKENAVEAATLIAVLRKALEPFAALGGPNDGIMPAFHDLPDDVIVYSNSGKHITAGNVRTARNAIGWLHAPRKATAQPYNTILN